MISNSQTLNEIRNSSISLDLVSTIPLLNDHDDHADKWTILKTANNSFICITCLIGNITSGTTSKNLKKAMLSELYVLSSESQSDFFTLLENELPVTSYFLKIILGLYQSSDILFFTYRLILHNLRY